MRNLTSEKWYANYSDHNQKEKLQVTAEEKYPELDKIATDIEYWVVDAINNRRLHVKTECPYPGQCILEMVIAKLEKAV